MTRFGWCMTGHHKDCPVAYEHWYQKGQMITCDCECHEQAREENVGAGGEGVPSGESGRAEKDSGTDISGPAPTKQRKPRGASKKSTSDD